MMTEIPFEDPQVSQNLQILINASKNMMKDTEEKKIIKQ